MSKASANKKAITKPARESTFSGRMEWIFVGVITLLAIGLHFVLMFNIGALWRDEVNSVELSTMPTLRDIGQNLQFDSFPMLWFLLLRTWAGLGLTSDLAYRSLGCLIGICILAALWWNARQCKVPFPFFSLVFFALHPTVIRYGDSMRAYGFGILLFVLMFAIIWRVIQSPTKFNFILAAVISVASVQAYYQNAVFLFAICSSGALICMRRKRWKDAVLLIVIGAIAAVSMLPYAAVFRSAKEWNMVMQLPQFDFRWFWEKLKEATDGMAWIWTGLFIAAISIGTWRQFRRREGDLSSMNEGQSFFSPGNGERDAILYALSVLMIGTVGFYFFLKTLSYFTQSWYYAALMALMGVTADVILAPQGSRNWRMIRLAVGFVVAFYLLPKAWPALHQRHTNIDLVAAKLKKEAAKEDLVILNPWYNGITFQRYYKGETAWLTLPPMEVPRLHRYDLVKRQMIAPEEAMQPLFEKIRQTLKAGHQVWIVGGIDLLKPGEKLLPLPPAPQGPSGWLDGFYYQGWSYRVGAFMQANAGELDNLTPESPQPVHRFENLPLLIVRGWRKP